MSESLVILFVRIVIQGENKKNRPTVTHLGSAAI